MQGYWECTNCGEGNQFRFYDDDHHPDFLAMFPGCKKDFIAVGIKWRGMRRMDSL